MISLALTLILAMATPARAQYNTTRVKVTHDETTALVKDWGARRAAVNHIAGYSVVDGPDGFVYLVIRESGNAFKDPGEITVEKYEDSADVAWDGRRAPVTAGHVDLSKDCQLLDNWVSWASSGSTRYAVIRRGDGSYAVDRGDGKLTSCPQSLCIPEAADALKPFFEVCAQAK